MSEDTISSRSWFGIRIQDALLILMFGALIVLAHQNLSRVYLASIAFLQLIEGRVGWLGRVWGRVASIILQLMIWWLLMDITGWLASQYYPLLLLPVVSTATYFGVSGTMLTSVAAFGVYLSLWLRMDWRQYELDPEGAHTLEIQGIALAVAALIVNLLGEARRTEATRYRRAAEQLAVANQNLREAEAAVRRSERLAALGQLSAGLAHELRNPLGSIRGSAELLERSVGGGDNPVARELAGIISEEVDRTNSLVTRFLDFARPLEPRREITDITQVIDQAARHAKVEIIRNYSPDVPPLPIDPSLMEQVFINLLTNATQASAPEAPITVFTRVLSGEAEICVVDRGCGIPPDKIETIFNPFVTTKQTGVGLGLAIVAKIVDGHGGRMSVESEPGKGSTFRLFLPLETPDTK
jgi:signal transduction histidine kinase